LHSVAQDIQRKAARELVPLNLYFEVTSRCNAACGHCYRAAPQGKELSTGAACEVLSMLAEQGAWFLTVSGGEPLTRSDIFEILECANGLGYVTRFKTNGILLHKETVRRLAEARPHAVHLPIYSADARTHDEFVGVPGAFERVLTAARELGELGVTVILSTVWMSFNIHEYERIRELAASLGTGVRGSPAVYYTQDGGGGPLRYMVRDRRVLERFYDKSFRTWPDLSERFRKRYIEGPSRKEMLSSRMCTAGVNRLRVDPAGTVHPCVSLSHPLGRLPGDDFDEIWSRPFLEKLRGLRFEHTEECRSCEYLRYCTRCPADVLAETGTLTGVSESACLLAAACGRAVGNILEELFPYEWTTLTRGMP
jgi:radical SAM protein with 4Fe4S-binding SPASM domain